MKRILTAFFVATLLATSAMANTIYTSTHGVGSGTVNLSITTDGTVGVLTTSNILDWTIAMTDGPDNFTLLGPLSGSNSGVLVSGSALTATANDLLFNFSAGGNQIALFQRPSVGSGQSFYCVQTNGCFDFDGAAEALDPRANFTYVKTAHTGNLVIASTSATSVPEPASASLVLMGVGALAFQIRRRNRS